MSVRPTIIEHPSAHRVSRAGQSIIAIVMHGTAGSDSLNYLTRNDKMVSTHYLIPRNGTTIYRMVDEGLGANHAGAPTSSFTLQGRTYKGSQVNKATIGVELESMQTGRNDYTDAQLSAMGWLISDIRTRHGPLPVLRHADLDPTRRRDPYLLTTQEIERWTAPYMPPPPPITKLYRVKHRHVTQRQEDNGPPYVRELTTDEPLVVDKWYTNNRAHLADGSGFVDMADLEAV